MTGNFPVHGLLFRQFWAGHSTFYFEENRSTKYPFRRKMQPELQFIRKLNYRFVRPSINEQHIEGKHFEIIRAF